MPRLSLALFCSYYKNFPKAFVDKQMQVIPKKIFGNRYGAPDLVQYEVHPDEYEYTEYRPWEMDAQFAQRNTKKKRDQAAWWENSYHSWDLEKPYRSKLTENDWTIFRGDRVQIMVGKDKGKHGVVRRIIRELDLCFVAGLNCVYKEINPPGYAAQLVLKERPLNYVKNEVELIDPNDLKPVKIKWMWNDEGKRLRISERTGEEIPTPKRELETYEYKSRETYVENSKDTTEEVVTENTYLPYLCTFEQDLMEEYRIKDDRKFVRTYWY